MIPKAKRKTRPSSHSAPLAGGPERALGAYREAIWQSVIGRIQIFDCCESTGKVTTGASKERVRFVARICNDSGKVTTGERRCITTRTVMRNRARGGTRMRWTQEGSYIERQNEQGEVNAQICITLEEGVEAEAKLARKLFAIMQAEGLVR